MFTKNVCQTKTNLERQVLPRGVSPWESTFRWGDTFLSGKFGGGPSFRGLVERFPVWWPSCPQHASCHGLRLRTQNYEEVMIRRRTMIITIIVVRMVMMIIVIVIRMMMRRGRMITIECCCYEDGDDVYCLCYDDHDDDQDDQDDDDDEDDDHDDHHDDDDHDQEDQWDHDSMPTWEFCPSQSRCLSPVVVLCNERTLKSLRCMDLMTGESNKYFTCAVT